MLENKKKGVDWSYLLLGILFIMTSLISFRNPFGNLVSIVLVFAIFAIVRGIFEIIIGNKVKNLSGFKFYLPIILGIFNILIGIYFMFNIHIGVAVLPFVFSIWFIADSIMGLLMLDLARAVSNAYFWFSLIINILGVLLGIMLLFDPITSALTISFLVGFYFLLSGISYIVYSFR